jgi:chromosome segregation ATPase
MRNLFKASLRPLGILLVCTLGGVGCSGSKLSHRVDMDKLKDMSRQGQIWIFDAENEIVVALDRLDEAREELSLIRLRKKQAEKSIEAAEKKRNRGAVEMAESWMKYLEAMERWAKRRIEASEVGVTAAAAAVELAKAQVINREDLLGGKDFAIKDYQDQYKEWNQDHQKELKRAARLRKAARELEQRWWVQRRRFTAQTGDYDSGLWTD